MQNTLQKFSTAKIIGIIVLVGLLAYGNAIFHPFVHDDVVFIEQNPNIGDLSRKSILSILTSYNMSNASGIINPYYRPILEIIYRLEYKFFGMNPFLFHLFNVVIHILNSILIFFLINLIMRGKKIFAACIAILFLLHPVQTEAVACVAGISNLLSAFLFLIGFILYAASGRGKRAFLLYALSLIVFFISLLTKEQAAMLPIVLIIYEYFFIENIFSLEKRKELIRVAVKVIGYFFILALYFIIRKSILGVAVTSFVGPKEELFLRLLSIPRTLLTYLSLSVYPINLHYFRSVDILAPYKTQTVLLLIVLILFYQIVTLIPNPRKKTIAFGGFWFLLTLLPTLNIIPLVVEYSLIFTAEHFLYLPLIGFIVLAIELFNYYFGDQAEYKYAKVKAAVFVVICLVFMVLTIRQNSFWKDEITLFKRTVKYQNNIARAHVLLGKAYYFQRNYSQAINEAEKAKQIIKSYLKKVEAGKVKNIYLGFLKGIYFDLAQYHSALMMYPESNYYYEQALQLDAKDGVLHNNIGVNYIALKDYEKAIWHFETALKINSNDLMAMNNLALCYINKGDELIAESILVEILKKHPGFIPAQDNLMRLYQKKQFNTLKVK